MSRSIYGFTTDAAGNDDDDDGFPEGEGRIEFLDVPIRMREYMAKKRRFQLDTNGDGTSTTAQVVSSSLGNYYRVEAGPNGGLWQQDLPSLLPTGFMLNLRLFETNTGPVYLDGGDGVVRRVQGPTGGPIPQGALRAGRDYYFILRADGRWQLMSPPGRDPTLTDGVPDVRVVGPGGLTEIDDGAFDPTLFAQLNVLSSDVGNIVLYERTVDSFEWDWVSEDPTSGVKELDPATATEIRAVAAETSGSSSGFANGQAIVELTVPFTVSFQFDPAENGSQIDTYAVGIMPTSEDIGVPPYLTGKDLPEDCVEATTANPGNFYGDGFNAIRRLNTSNGTFGGPGQVVNSPLTPWGPSSVFEVSVDASGVYRFALDGSQLYSSPGHTDPSYYLVMGFWYGSSLTDESRLYNITGLTDESIEDDVETVVTITEDVAARWPVGGVVTFATPRDRRVFVELPDGFSLLRSFIPFGGSYPVSATGLQRRRIRNQSASFGPMAWQIVRLETGVFGVVRLTNESW